MRFQRSILGAGVTFLFLMMASQGAHSTTAIVRTEPGTPPSATVQTFAGPVQAKVTPVKPSPALTVVLLLDNLHPENSDALVQSLTELFNAQRGRPFRIATISGTDLKTAPAITSHARIKALVDKVFQNPTAAAFQPSIAPIEVLISSADKLGADWSRVVIVGELPTLDSPTTEFAAAKLANAFGSQHVQLSWLSSSNLDAWAPALQSIGGRVVASTEQLTAPQTGDVYQLEWDAAAPPTGFVVNTSLQVNPPGTAPLPLPEITSAVGVAPPSIDKYAAISASLGESETILKQPSVEKAQADRIRAALQSALDINPRDVRALLLAAAFYERSHDFATAVTLSALLLDVRPLDPEAHATYGHALLLAGDLAKSEIELKRAIELGGLKPPLAEDLAQLYEARHDDADADPMIAEVLRLDPKRQDLWFEEASIAARLHDTARAISSYEQGLALNGIHIAETGALLRLYIATKQEPKAVEFARRSLAALPPDPSARTAFASMLDEVLPREALAAWRTVLAVQPSSEIANVRVARLLLASGDAAGADKAADAGLALLPDSAALTVVKADALDAQHQSYASRSVLEDASAKSSDAALLLRWAAAEDTYTTAAATYAKVAAALPANSPDRLRILERGFATAVRDNDLKLAQTFSQDLAKSGHPEFHRLLGEGDRANSGAVIPGGLDALAFVAHMHEGIPPETFLQYFCRALIDNSSTVAGRKEDPYIEGIRDYLQRIAALEPYGKRDANGLTITLSIDTNESRKKSERVLEILGVNLRRANGLMTVARSEKKGQAQRQDTAEALALDEISMQKAFQQQKPYEMVIPFESASVYPDEATWRSALAVKRGSGEILSAMLRSPKLAKLYVGLSSLDHPTFRALMSNLTIVTLSEKYADTIYSYAPAFGIENGHAAVPGGIAAEPIWTQMVHANPSNPGAFFRALLETSDGKLLAYFFALSQLDRAHQMFFTASAARTMRFYEAFLATPEMQQTHSAAALHDSAVTRMLRAVPLDKDGHVAFPGSPEVWMIAKGHSASAEHTAKLMKQVSRAVAPDVEDEVLLRLANTQYKAANMKTSELDNFLAVTRLDMHRIEPLDEETALVLAQNYSEFSDLYAYFDDITELQHDDFLQFFAAINRTKNHGIIDANLQLGQLHALVEWISLLRRREMIDDDAATTLFRSLMSRFTAADESLAYTRASLDSAKEILSHCKLPGKPSDKLHDCLLGSSSLDSSRTRDFDRVLDMQKVPPVSALLAAYDALVNISARGAAGADLASVEALVTALSSQPLTKQINGREKSGLQRYDPSEVKKSFEQIKDKIAKHKSKDVEKYAQEMLADLQPQVTLALAGPVYAYYLRSTDLVVSDDPLLLRKHRYFDFMIGNRKVLTPPSTLIGKSSESGTYFLGGFAQFGIAAGHAAAATWKTGGAESIDAIAVQIAATRGTEWSMLNVSDQRLLALRIQVAREWIYEAARSPSEFRALSEETLGLLSLNRRADLLNGVESYDWRKAWNAITLPELFALGGKYLSHYKTDPWTSPVTVALREAVKASNGAHLASLGPIPYHTFGCSHPHLLSDAPYEEYERHYFPVEIAERSAEFDLFLAFQADSVGIDPKALSNIAEPLAAKAFKNSHLSSDRDWRSLLAAYGSISLTDLRQALDQQ